MPRLYDDWATTRYEIGFSRCVLPTCPLYTASQSMPENHLCSFTDRDPPFMHPVRHVTLGRTPYTPYTLVTSHHITSHHHTRPCHIMSSHEVTS